MSLVLNIDTALEVASVCLSMEGKPLALKMSEDPKDHAGWLHPAIQTMLGEKGHTINQLDAIAVSIGPGSYTGLRVGLASAKGFCYALNIPLIAVSTLEMMAWAVKEETTDLVCPLIDARRTEVFTAIYDQQLREKFSPQAMVIDANSFDSFLTGHKILFCGSGRKKLQALLSSPNASFTATVGNASHLAQLSHRHWGAKNFANLVYTEPLYIKEFYSPHRQH